MSIIEDLYSKKQSGHKFLKKANTSNNFELTTIPESNNTSSHNTCKSKQITDANQLSNKLKQALKMKARDI